MKRTTQTKDNCYQTVSLTFSDGSKASFTGPAYCWPGDKRKIIDVEFTAPKPLPANCTFEEVEKR